MNRLLAGLVLLVCFVSRAEGQRGRGEHQSADHTAEECGMIHKGM